MIYTFPRAREYFEPDELSLATGVSSGRFAEVILKELLDNALDEAEKTDKPVIQITGDPLAVRDNGPGADLDDLVGKVLDFSVRASSKLAWKRPTRGYLGNALKTVFGMAHVLAPEKPVVLESRGQKVSVTIRPLSTGEIRVNPVLEKVPEKVGFAVRAPLSVIPICYDTLKAAVLFNPHVSFTINGYEYPKVGNLDKYPADAPVSPHWFDPGSLFNLITLVAGQEDLTVREFVSRHFTGLSGTKAGQAARSCPVKRVRDFAALEESRGRKTALDACAGLLRAMKELSRPVSPAKLGGVGRENFAARINQVYGDGAVGDGRCVRKDTGKEVPLGTREVANYLPPDYLYNKVLYVEKKGVLPVLKAAGLEKKYDLCLCAGEGYASRAAKDFLAMAEKQDVTVLCLHDLDINGLEIARTLKEETKTSRNAVKVIDLGLRYKDVVEMGLEKDPEGVLLRKGWYKPALDGLPYDEYKFLTGDMKHGNRVELNALTPEQLIGFIERKLAEHGLTEKVIPPGEVIVGEARRHFDLALRAVAERRILEMLEIPAVVEKITQSVKAPDFGGLPEDIAWELKDNPPVSWRDLTEKEARDFAWTVMRGIDLGKFLKIDHER